MSYYKHEWRITKLQILKMFNFKFLIMNLHTNNFWIKIKVRVLRLSKTSFLIFRSMEQICYNKIRIFLIWMDIQIAIKFYSTSTYDSPFLFVLYYHLSEGQSFDTDLKNRGTSASCILKRCPSEFLTCPNINSWTGNRREFLRRLNYEFRSGAEPFYSSISFEESVKLGPFVLQPRLAKNTLVPLFFNLCDLVPDTFHLDSKILESGLQKTRVPRNV